MSRARPASSACPEPGDTRAMCFKNLPIEFDAQGKPYLKAGIADPYADHHGAARRADQLSADQHRGAAAAQRPHQGPRLRSGHPGRRRAGVPHRGRLQEPQGARGALGGDAVPRLRGDHGRPRSARRDLHHQPRLRRLRRRALDVLGAGDRDGDRHACRRRSASSSATSRSRCEFLYDHPLHLLLLAGPGLLRGDGRADEPGAARRGRDAARRRTRDVHGYRTIGDDHGRTSTR